MMVIPVSQHKLIKIRRVNRDRLTKLAFICSSIACGCNVLASSTNHWLYTSEVLRYFVFPNQTMNFDDTVSQHTVYFKNATIGPYLYCWRDPITPFHCNTVFYLTDEDPSDTTTSVQQSVRRAFLFMLVGMIIDLIGLVVAGFCWCLKNPYASLLASSLLHINSGIANFSCIIVYMSAVSKEVGNKIHAASEMDDPLFYVSYGFSFLLLKTSFLMTEMAALFSIVVYMAKRDERTFNRYKIRATFNYEKSDSVNTDFRQRSILSDNLQARYNRRTGSMALDSSPPPELDSMIKKEQERGLQRLKPMLGGSVSLFCDPLARNADKEKTEHNRSKSIKSSSSTSQPLRRFAIPVAQDTHHYHDDY